MAEDIGQIAAQPLSTGQPPRDIRRQAQYGKFFVHTHAFTPFTSAAAGTTAQTSFTVDGQTVGFALMRIAVLADNLGDKILLTATPNGEQFSFDPHYLTHFGGGQFPLNISPAWLLRKNGILKAVITDTKLVPGNNNVRIAYFGQKVYDRPLIGPRRYHAAKHWFYPANFTAQDSGRGALIANETRSYTVRIDSDSDFEIQKLSVASDGPVTVQVQTDADDWFESALRSELLGGSLIEIPVAPIDASGWHPFILPAPRLIIDAGYIKVTVTNQVAAVNRCEVQFHGTRLYPAGGRGVA